MDTLSTPVAPHVYRISDAEALELTERPVPARCKAFYVDVQLRSTDEMERVVRQHLGWGHFVDVVAHHGQECGLEGVVVYALTWYSAS